MILGTTQDGGYPHINNTVEFEAVQNTRGAKGLVVLLGMVDQDASKRFKPLNNSMVAEKQTPY